MSKNHLCFSYPDFSETIRSFQNFLQKLKLTDKEILHTELLLEETFLRWKNNIGEGTDFIMNVEIIKSFSSIVIEMSVKGKEFNPLAEMGEILGEKSEDSLRLSILQANRDRMSFVYKNGVNHVKIRVRSGKKSHARLMVTLGSLTAGFIAGLLMRTFLSGETVSSVNTYIVGPIRTLILDIVKMFVGPVVFFSILSGMLSVSGTLNVGKIGKQLITVSLSMMIANTVAAVALSLAIFHEDLSYMKAFIQTSGTPGSGSKYSLANLIFDTVPKNVVEPFMGQNILQVIALSIFIGVILLKMGDEARPVFRIVNFINRFLMTSMQVIVKLVPLLVFVSMIGLSSATGLSFFLSMGKIFLGQGIGVFIAFFISFVATLLWTKTSPIPLLIKVARFLPTPFSIMNDNATLPFTMQCCQEDIGIDPGMASFTVPLGIQLNKSGQCFFLSMSTSMMFCIYGIHPDPQMLAVYFITVLLMALTKPTIPGGGIIVLNYLFSVMGVPQEAVMLIVCIDAISVLFNVLGNNTTNITTSFIIARKQDMVDMEKYRKI